MKLTIQRITFFLFPVILVFNVNFQPSLINAQTQTIVSSKTVHSLDSVLQKFVADGNISGVSALVFEKGEEVYFNAFGMADREKEIPMDRNTIVQIYSMTKPITGVALMQLFEKGLFKLDDPLQKYIPEFSSTKVFGGLDSEGNMILEDLDRPITIRDITRHTSGFANDRNQPVLGDILSEKDPGNRNNTLDQYVQKLAEVPLAFQPGTQWYYGPSVDVQAYLVQKISGIPYDEYLQKNIFDLLSMDEIGYYVSEENQPRFAASYQYSDDGILSRISDEEAHSFNTQKWTLKPGGWGLTSTIDDYMTFAKMLLNKGTLEGKQILKKETIELMSTNHLSDTISQRLWLPSKGQVGFGIDFAVRTNAPLSKEENYGVEGEFFWDGAASTLFWVDPKNDLVAVLFVQLFPFDRIGLHKKFRDAVYNVDISEN